MPSRHKNGLNTQKVTSSDDIAALTCRKAQLLSGHYGSPVDQIIITTASLMGLMTTASSSTPQKPRPISPAPGASRAKPEGQSVLSPHLQIWRFTITLAASITHRGCGVALYTGSAVLALWLYATAFSPALFDVMSGLLKSPIGIIALAGYSWALFFHMANGVRHLFWDVGHGFELETARRTAWAAYIWATVMMGVVLGFGLNNAGIL